MHLVNEEIENYCLSKSSTPSSLCKELHDYTVKNVPMAVMLIGPLEASVLGFLTRVTNAKRILEVGCFTGYSALAMAEQLPDQGEVVTLDINAETTKIGQEF
jgi:caffeoyl-CoA O-methyltransferase